MKGGELRVVTIGVYGFDEDDFFEALRAAHVDTFCDLRHRRGVRGKRYRFANSKRLQERLAQEGIRYLHLKAFAPSMEVRALQKADDKRLGVRKGNAALSAGKLTDARSGGDESASKRSARSVRKHLSPAFVEAYEAQCLKGDVGAAFLEAVGPEARVAALFCVEREAKACHRSLVANRLAEELGCEVRHLEPGAASPRQVSR